MANLLETSASRYKTLEQERQPYLDRARECSALTLPAIMPPDNTSGKDKLDTPYQALGARGVNHLAAKLGLTLFPPNSSFFRLSMTEKVLAEAGMSEDARTEVEETLASFERALMTEVEEKAYRSKLITAIKNLIISGNVCLYISEDGIRVFKLSDYVCVRDSSGNLLESITKEAISIHALSEEIIAEADLQEKLDEEKRSDEELDLYTHAYLDKGVMNVYQEINGVALESTRSEYPQAESPFVVIRYAVIDGENYGRGLCEEYLGDLKTYDLLNKVLLEASAAAAKILYFVNPNGVTNKQKIAKAKNGDVVSGNAGDVSILQLNKSHDLSIASNQAKEIEQRLSYAFMMQSAIQRGGERVTAGEIRYMASELEDSLGGVYSTLSLELQLPLVARLLSVLQKAGKLPELPNNTVKPVISTGIEALGRGHDIAKLDTFMQKILPLGPEVIAKVLNTDDFIKRVANGLSIDTQTLIKTTEQIQQEQQQEMAMQQQQGLGAGGGMDALNSPEMQEMIQQATGALQQ